MRFFSNLRYQFSFGDLAPIHVGDVAINPEWTWIEVQNPKGRRNGNGFHGFGDSAGIKARAKLTVVAIDGDQVLVSYESPKGQGFGSEAGNGTLFFVSQLEFIGMTAKYHREQASQSERKARVLRLLRETLSSETA
ncbi:MAG: hypothetical protein A2934_02965 [Candidatus Sungbacteria bacterium RIFCSPLOWO2_01_FULL_47_10]|uniref:Uncharacterized protein n=1 Tax=Candidatus Sungbacteria bacterium RIFCSPLOWO2_01_FULL_47_10 TaxID=1802276 RepID=A0A1G2L820_9BACT|nr:MAG: hypothetical protein A2934_02965 [Candidatus Sungbacteria bacterium RIFCSPLOWO2_01_FULL_47_10]